MIEAYQSGYFPMPMQRRNLGWYSPDPRGVLQAGELIISKSLRRSIKRFEVTIDQAFGSVIRACADPRRPQGWINRRITDAYCELHKMGVAHSIEVWNDGLLVGGLYGVGINGLFAGESMFHHETDASKVALVKLVEILGLDGPVGSSQVLLDVQWATDHLRSLGVKALSRTDYGTLLAASQLCQAPKWP